MAGIKRKAAAAELDSRPSRRQSARVSKAAVYAESDAEESQSDDDFKEEDIHNSEDEDGDNSDEADRESESAGRSEDDDEDGSGGEFEAKLKREGWVKKKGKDGKISMVMALPEEKDPGDTPYEDERIHPNTLDFLKDLKKHNDRDWMKFHDRVFRQAERDFYSFVNKVTSVISQKDPLIPERPIKDVIFRVYRDVRFSPDKTPYKPYFSASWSRSGRKGSYAHYYFHLQPGGGSFFGGGYYGTDNDTLACIREDIDTQPEQFRGVIMAKKLRSTFFPNIKNDEQKLLAAFCKMSGENALKKKPKDYAADHKDIALLKLKSFVLRKDILDAEIMGEHALETVADIVEAIVPFITYLNNAVVPDL